MKTARDFNRNPLDELVLKSHLQKAKEGIKRAKSKLKDNRKEETVIWKN
jgi:hypothetical protein